MAEDWGQYETGGTAAKGTTGTGAYYAPGGGKYLSPYEKLQAELKEKEAIIAAEANKRRGVSEFKLIQSYMMADDIEEWNKKNVPHYEKIRNAPGLKWTPGVINKVLGEWFRENPHVKPFIGDQNTTAMEFVRAIMPTRAAKLVEMTLESLPDIGSTPEERDNQLTASLISAIGTHMHDNPEDYPEVDPKDPMSKTLFILQKRDEMQSFLKQTREVAAVVREAKVEGGLLMMSPEGEVEQIESKNYAEAAKAGYKPVTKKQKKELGF